MHNGSVTSCQETLKLYARYSTAAIQYSVFKIHFLLVNIQFSTFWVRIPVPKSCVLQHLHMYLFNQQKRVCSVINNSAVVSLLLYSSLPRFLESSTEGITRTSHGMLSSVQLFLSDYCLAFLMVEHVCHMVCTTYQRGPTQDHPCASGQCSINLRNNLLQN